MEIWGAAQTALLRGPRTTGAEVGGQEKAALRGRVKSLSLSGMRSGRPEGRRGRREVTRGEAETCTETETSRSTEMELEQDGKPAVRNGT